MIRAVFDTNVLVSYLLTHRPPIATLIDRHLAHEDFYLVTRGKQNLFCSAIVNRDLVWVMHLGRAEFIVSAGVQIVAPAVVQIDTRPAPDIGKPFVFLANGREQEVMDLLAGQAAAVVPPGHRIFVFRSHQDRFHGFVLV